MTPAMRLLSLILAILCTSIPAAPQAQTPLPRTAPQLAAGLRSLALDPPAVVPGQTITATVALTRPALSRLEVRLELPGATFGEGAGAVGVWRVDCVAVLDRVYVEPGAMRATFTIGTGAPGSATWTGSRSYTITARMGPERVSASFRLMRPCQAGA